MIVLDTCAMIYDALDPDRIPARAARAIEKAHARGQLACSGISWWEIGWLVVRGRLDPGTGALDFMRLIEDSRDLVTLPLSPEIAVISSELQIHGDPADRVISATAIKHGAQLVTGDRKLLSASEVPTLWD
jgi:PIN domain nuclease of toxin-antitoxin system